MPPPKNRLVLFLLLLLIAWSIVTIIISGTTSKNIIGYDFVTNAPLPSSRSIALGERESAAKSQLPLNHDNKSVPANGDNVPHIDPGSILLGQDVAAVGVTINETNTQFFDKSHEKRSNPHLTALVVQVLHPHRTSQPRVLFIHKRHYPDQPLMTHWQERADCHLAKM